MITYRKIIAKSGKWTLVRFLRLIVGMAVLVQAFLQEDLLFGMAGGMLILLALFNVGCCGTGSCKVDLQKREIPGTITYEELDKKI